MNYTMYQYRPDVKEKDRDLKEKDRDLSTLVAHSVWLSKYEALNDPFEFAGLLEAKDFPDVDVLASNVGIACFCRAKTNPLLWSHYAAAHKGFAIGWDMSHPWFGRANGTDKSFLHDVVYEDIPLDPRSFGNGSAFLMSSLTTKSTAWAYEQEVRLIAKCGGRSAQIPKEAIKEILFGMAMSSERMSEIRSNVLAAGMSPSFAKMTRRSGSYGVSPEAV